MATIAVCCVTHLYIQNIIEHCASVITEIEEFLFEENWTTKTQRCEASRRKSFVLLCALVVQKIFAWLWLITIVNVASDDKNYRTYKSAYSEM